MKIGIKIKLALILSVLLFITTFSIGFMLIAHQRASLEAQMRSMAGTITHEFASDSKIPFMQKDSLAMNLLVQNILKYPGISDAYILNHNFMVEAPGDAGKAAKESGAALIQGASSGAPPWLVRDSGGVITFASPIVFQGTTVGYTVVSFSNSFIQERVHLAVNRVTVIGIIAVAAVSLLSIPLSSTLLRPIFRLFKGTQEIALGNFDYRIPEISKDEIGDLVSSFNRMASELKKKELLKGVFNRYVSPHVADEIFKDPETIRLGGDRRDVTILFADIRGFTAMSRSMEPEAIVEVLNRYFTLVTEIIFRFEGTIDKFIGDAVMSVFGSPIRTSIHLDQGIKAAVAIKLAVQDVNQARRMQGFPPLQMGIGINSGEVIVGNMGSQSRMEYTAVGDAVNVASRLTDLAKAGDILVSEDIYRSIRNNVVAEERPGVAIKGMDKPVTVYNIIGLKGAWDEEVENTVYKVITELEREGVVL